jgi:hypothetical protein
MSKASKEDENLRRLLKMPPEPFTPKAKKKPASKKKPAKPTER